MNRVLLLLLSVLTINLFGKVFTPPELLTTKTIEPLTQLQKSKASSSQSNRITHASMLMDTVPPIINCPASDTVVLAPQGVCDTVLNYSVTATDDQSQAIVIQLSGLSSGSIFPVGTSTCVFLATDLSGNTATCSFSLTVEDGATTMLVCNDLDTVELGINCTYTLLAQEILLGGPYGCWDRYFTEVDKTAPLGNGPWLAAVFNTTDIGKTYQSRVTDTKTGNRCWGNVKIVDKIPPVFTCQDLVVSCSEYNLSPNFLKDSLGLTAAIPIVSDACGPIDPATYVDIMTETFDCDTVFTKIISRRWQAKDAQNNIGTCIQHINLYRHTLAEMQIPPDVTLNCPDTTTTPSVTGLPFLMYQGRRYETVNNSICDLSAFYEDFPLKLPCGDVRVQRLWEFFDFCTGVTDGPFLQNIYILDETGPSIACPSSLFVTLNADTCHGMVNLPDVVLDDVCSQIATFQAFWEVNGLAKTLIGSLANFAGNNPLDFDTLGVIGMALFPVGTTTISYVAEDSCGNIGDCTFNLTVADMVPPVARCDTFSILQLLDDGSLSVAATEFNNGATDACSPVTFKARFLEISACLYDTLWTDSLRFCCLNQEDTLDAVLRVYDIPTPFGNVSASFGNGHFSDCAMKIIVKDQNPPSCTAPQNLTVNCNNFDPTLASYGIITSTSCAVDSISMDVDYTQFDTACNRGVITRIFKVFDGTGNIGGCAQAVTVNYLQDYYTKFPNDVIATVCDATGLYGQPIFFGQDCEDFDVDFTDQLFAVVPDACYKIERTWKITNKCTYDPDKPLIVIPNPNPNTIANHSTNLPGPTVSACNAPPPWVPTSVKINPTDPTPTDYCTFWRDTANGYQYIQIIKVIDNQASTGTFTAPTCANQNWATVNNPQFWNENYWYNTVIGGNDLFEEPTELSFTGADACSGANVNIEYLLFLDLDENGSMETVINSVTLGLAGLGWNTVLYNNFNSPNFAMGTLRAFDERPVPFNQKMGFAIEETISGNNKTARVRWNSQQQQNTYFAPELPHGTHKIKWFITDNCGNNKEYENTFIIKDCKVPTVVCQPDLSVNILPVGFNVFHPSDFLDFSEDNCTPADQIRFAIRNCGFGTGFPLDANGNPNTSILYACPDTGMQCVELWAIDKAGNADKCVTNVFVQDNLGNCISNPTGRVITELGVGISDVGIKIGDNCSFCPPFAPLIFTDSLGYYKIPNNLPLSSDFDIIPEKTDNPLNGVTTFDLVLISKHILGVEPLNSPYKMVCADANKSGSVTTFDVVELRKLILGINAFLPNNKSWRFVDSSFVFPNPLNPFQTGFPDSIQVDSPKPYNFIGMKIGDVNNTSVPNFNATTKERFAGTVYFDTEERDVQVGEIIELKFSASERLEGCQFTLETDGLEILEILPGEQMSKENFALFPQKSLLTMAWETGGQANFGLKVKAQKTGSLRELLLLSNEITQAEAYQSIHQPSTKQHLALRFGNPSASFELFQNQPNPFAQKTAITFQLPEPSSAVLTVFDGNGKLLWSKSGDFQSGLNTVEIDLAELSVAGVLYYKLETPTKTAVRKMVRIGQN